MLKQLNTWMEDIGERVLLDDFIANIIIEEQLSNVCDRSIIIIVRCVKNNP